MFIVVMQQSQRVGSSFAGIITWKESCHSRSLHCCQVLISFHTCHLSITVCEGLIRLANKMFHCKFQVIYLETMIILVFCSFFLVLLHVANEIKLSVGIPAIFSFEEETFVYLCSLYPALV